MKAIDRSMVGSAEGNVDAAINGTTCAMQPERRGVFAAKSRDVFVVQHTTWPSGDSAAA